MERMPFKQAVEELVELYSGWGIPPEKWRLCDGGSLRLQNYDIEMDYDRYVLNTAISAEDWPWPRQLREEYRKAFGVFMIPPKDSNELDEHCRFVLRTGYGLATHVVNADLSLISSVVYELSNENQVYLQTAQSVVDIYGILIQEGVNWDERQIRAHLEIVEEIQRCAEQRGEDALAESCEMLLTKYPI